MKQGVTYRFNINAYDRSREEYGQKPFYFSTSPVGSVDANQQGRCDNMMSIGVDGVIPTPGVFIDITPNENTPHLFYAACCGGFYPLNTYMGFELNVV